jgi:hypothetical protein
MNGGLTLERNNPMLKLPSKTSLIHWKYQELMETQEAPCSIGGFTSEKEVPHKEDFFSIKDNQLVLECFEIANM